MLNSEIPDGKMLYIRAVTIESFLKQGELHYSSLQNYLRKCQKYMNSSHPNKLLAPVVQKPQDKSVHAAFTFSVGLGKRLSTGQRFIQCFASSWTTDKPTTTWQINWTIFTVGIFRKHWPEHSSFSPLKPTNKGTIRTFSTSRVEWTYINEGGDVWLSR